MKRILMMSLLTLTCLPALADDVGLRGTLVPSSRSAVYDAEGGHCQASQAEEEFPWGISYEARQGYRVAAYLVLNGEMQRIADTVVEPEHAKGFLKIPHVTWPADTEAQFYFTIEDNQGAVVDELRRGQYRCSAVATNQPVADNGERTIW